MEASASPPGRTMGPDGNMHDDASSARASSVLAPYLCERSPEFRELSELRQKGWRNPEGDVFFQAQRRRADQCDRQTAAYFYRLMKIIGAELNQATGAFDVGRRPARILDLCMAPGGFLATALGRNPGASAVAFSLPPALGGHEVLLPRSEAVDVRLVDITMLGEDMGAGAIPAAHPDAGRFEARQLAADQLFDLVLCDGQVLRTHARAAYRERREVRRLAATQLALGLAHLRPGGTMVVLLHKVEAWWSAVLLRAFARFAAVRVFKPRAGHATRSSFYLVASAVDSRHPAAAAAAARWRAEWRAATFGDDAEYEAALRDGDDASLEELLDDFGPELVRLGRDIWRVQAAALARAPFIRGSSR